jgi:hypothetical protein
MMHNVCQKDLSTAILCSTWIKGVTFNFYLKRVQITRETFYVIIRIRG